MSTARWPLDVFSAGPVAAGAKLWRGRGELHATVIAKVSFALVPGGEAQRIEPLEVVREEVYARGNPMSPLLAASDLAPWLERAEVVLTGHAWAPGGAPVRRMPVRLVVLRGGAALVDKRLEVVGDREATAASPSPEPEPFVRMPIEVQRSWGGPGEPENPFGVGAVQDAGGRTSLPNLLPPGGGRAPVSLGPVPSILPSRTRLLRGLARAELDGVASIPDDFDWSYFQSAPVDQRFDRVLGGEEIVLEGLSPRHAVLATRLPALRALATIYLPNGAQRWFMLSGDTLIVQGDAERCAVVFRGSFQIASEEALPGLRVAVGVEVGGAPVPWPAVQEVLARAPIAQQVPESVKQVDWSTTVTLDDEDVVEAPASVTVVLESPLERTLAIATPPAAAGVDADAEAAEEEMPRRAQTVPLPGAAFQGHGDAVNAPFRIAPAGARPERESGEIPGAPWATSRASVIPVIESPLDSTVALRVPVAAPGAVTVTAALTVTAPAAAPAPVTAPAAAPAPVTAPAAAPGPWAEPAPEPPAPAPPSPKPQRPDLVGNLYKRFRKS